MHVVDLSTTSSSGDHRPTPEPSVPSILPLLIISHQITTTGFGEKAQTWVPIEPGANSALPDSDDDRPQAASRSLVHVLTRTQSTTVVLSAI